MAARTDRSRLIIALGAVMRVTRFAIFLLAVSALSLGLAFITARTPDPLDQWIMGAGAVAAVVAAGVAVWCTENPMASVALLPLSLASAIIGNYLPYLAGLWGLDSGDFSAAAFPAGLAYLVLAALVIGLVLGLVIEAAHMVVSARMTRLHEPK